jgi:hypothetical protein
MYMDQMVQATPSAAPAAPQAKKSSGNKVAGITIALLPVIGLMLVFAAYAYTKYIENDISATPPDYKELGEQIMSFIQIAQPVLGFLGILCIIGILVCVPLGIMVYRRKDNGRINTSEAIKFGWTKTKQHFGFLLGAIVVSIVVSLIPSLITTISEAGGTKLPTIAEALITLLGVIINYELGLGWLVIALGLADNQTPVLKQLFPDPKKLFSYIAALILYTLIVLGGLILLIVPGIIWSYKFILYPYYVLQGAGPIEALKRSAQATQGVKLEWFGFCVLLGLINFLGFLALLVGLIATVPLTMIAMAYAFRQLEKGTPPTPVATSTPTQ